MTPTSCDQPPLPVYGAPPEDGDGGAEVPAADGCVPAAPVGAAPTGVTAVPPVVEGAPEAGVDGVLALAGVCVGPATEPPVAPVPAAPVDGVVAETVLGALVDGAVAGLVVVLAVVDAAACWTVLVADALGAVMPASARERIPPPRGERKLSWVGVAMTMPMLPATRSMRDTALSEATCARSCPFAVCRVVACSIARPMLELSRSRDTCMATIPTSRTPSTGIHARPRTSRSVSE
jgi:hypothetical protein